MNNGLSVALSCGEPAGIGPEIAAAAWRELDGSLPFFWIGDCTHLPPDLPVVIISDAADAAHAMARGLPVLHRDFGAPAVPGQPDPQHAAHVIAAIKDGCDLVTAGQARALCTGPIHKKALKDGAGFGFPGHTEFLADIVGVDHVVMMLASETLRVVPTTIHIPLSEVPAALTPELLESTIRITQAALIYSFGVTAPRIAVAGLNPHAGEGGAMGREELDWIGPMIARMQAEGMKVTGPMSADTMFHGRAREGYDVAICMYHDQALIPIKTLAFDEGVNVTLGLPFMRTSPDHGTAFDIAGQGLANPSSLIAALKMAHKLSL